MIFLQLLLTIVLNNTIGILTTTYLQHIIAAIKKKKKKRASHAFLFDATTQTANYSLPGYRNMKTCILQSRFQSQDLTSILLEIQDQPNQVILLIVSIVILDGYSSNSIQPTKKFTNVDNVILRFPGHGETLPLHGRNRTDRPESFSLAVASEHDRHCRRTHLD